MEQTGKVVVVLFDMPNIPYLLYFPLTDIPWEVFSYSFLEFIPWVVLALLAILSLVALVLEVRSELNSQREEVIHPFHGIDPCSDLAWPGKNGENNFSNPVLGWFGCWLIASRDERAERFLKPPRVMR